MTNPSERVEPARRPRVVQVLLGVFVLWQLVFIIGSSILALPEESPLPPLSRVFENYSWLTGQEQGWRQFTPGAPKQSAFVAVTFHWKDGRKPIEVVSESEPGELRSFLRGFGATRLSGYELQFTMVGLKPGAADAADNPKAWREPIVEAVRDQVRPMRAYLAWRLREFQREHPELPPPEHVTLSLRVYRVPPPTAQDRMLQGPAALPLARWRPGQNGVEAYDPVTRSFGPLPPQEEGR